MADRQTLLFEIAQLRHAYAQLHAGQVRDQRGFADGLIAPAIRFLETLGVSGGQDCTAPEPDAGSSDQP